MRLNLLCDFKERIRQAVKCIKDIDMCSTVHYYLDNLHLLIHLDIISLTGISMMSNFGLRLTE